MGEDKKQSTDSGGPGSNEEKYGFNLYPERRSESSRTFSFWEFMFSKNYTYRKNKFQCEDNILTAVKENPMVKLLLGALKSAGCPVNLKRHIVCEECDASVTGGYDQELNQIVVCQNSYKSRKSPEAVLIHELVHMFDICVNEADFSNMDHLACSEIRAANIAHCSFISSLLLGQSSPINIKKTHQYCVKMKAAQSIMLARGVEFYDALDAILKVFDKCYNDLEPIGRRIRRNSAHMMLAYKEGYNYGYCER